MLSLFGWYIPLKSSCFSSIDKLFKESDDTLIIRSVSHMNILQVSRAIKHFDKDPDLWWTYRVNSEGTVEMFDCTAYL